MEFYNNHVVEERGTCFGIPYAILFLRGGYRTAYVNVKGTKYQYMDYNSVDMPVHWGLTYGDYALPFETERELSDEWWLGWDYCHCDDGYDEKTAKKYYDESIPKLLRSVQPFATLEEVRMEVVKACKWIKEGEE